MALVPLKQYAKENPFSLSISMLRAIADKPGGDRIFRRVSDRHIYVDSQLMEEWINSQKFYSPKDQRNKKKETASPILIGVRS